MIACVVRGIECTSVLVMEKGNKREHVRIWDKSQKSPKCLCSLWSISAHKLGTLSSLAVRMESSWFTRMQNMTALKHMQLQTNINYALRKRHIHTQPGTYLSAHDRRTLARPPSSLLAPHDAVVSNRPPDWQMRRFWMWAIGIDSDVCDSSIQHAGIHTYKHQGPCIYRVGFETKLRKKAWFYCMRDSCKLV